MSPQTSTNCTDVNNVDRMDEHLVFAKALPLIEKFPKLTTDCHHRIVWPFLSAAWIQTRLSLSGRVGPTGQHFDNDISRTIGQIPQFSYEMDQSSKAARSARLIGQILPELVHFTGSNLEPDAGDLLEFYEPNRLKPNGTASQTGCRPV